MTRAPAAVSLLAVSLGSLGLVLALATTSGCEPVRELVLSPVLPTPCVPASVNELRVRGLGDFAPAPADTMALGGAAARLDLPRGTRVVAVQGLASAGVVAVGRSAPMELPDAWEVGGPEHRIPIAYGPPDTFCATAPLAYPRGAHRATLLVDGSVLLSGGVDRGGFAVTVLERYLPGGDQMHPSAAFVPVGIAEETATIAARAALGHDATRLADGRVLLSGGAPVLSGLADGNAFEGAQWLGPDGQLDGTTRLLGGGPRAFHAGVLLPDGRVLLSGGCAVLRAGACAPGETLASAVIYDPGTDSYASGFALGMARAGHRALLRDDGLVLIIGGRGEGGVAPPPELYDPAEARASTIAGPAGGAVMLPSGLVVAINDAAGPSARAVAWSGRDEAPVLLPQLGSERAEATLTAMEDGAVLVAGGGDGAILSPSSTVLTVGGVALELEGFIGRGHTATLLTDGSVLLAGGQDESGPASARGSLFLRSLVGPFQTPPSLSFDGAITLVPSRPERVSLVDGELVIEAVSGAARTPESFALLAGPLVAGPNQSGFDLSLLVGDGGDGSAALLFGDPGRGRYLMVRFSVGEPVRFAYVDRERPGLLRVTEVEGCHTEILSAEELPASGLAPLSLRARGGRIELKSRSRLLLRCEADERTPVRGAVAVGALRGRVRWDNLSLER